MGRWGGITRKVILPGERKLPGLSLRAAKGAPKRSGKPPKRRRVAVLITHGMGQQLPFETLDSLAEGLIATAQDQSKTKVPMVRAITARLGELTTQRVEFDTKDKEGKDVEVHVYEGYWAPLTEGQIGLTDVMWFLLHAAGSGIRISFGRFSRWIFGTEVDFGKVAGALPSLLFATAILLSLVLLNAVIAAFSAYRIFDGDLGNLCSSGVVEPGCKYYALTFVTGCFGLVTIVTAAVLYCLSKLNRFGETPGIRFVIRMPLLGFFWVLIIGWSLMALFWWLPLISGPAEILNQYDIVSTVGKRLWLPIWGLLAFGSWVVKLFLVEYVGDVAAYISSHSLDKFNDLRIRIKATVFTIAKAIYAQKDQPYDGVILAGHSLGSVITYDTLNALINDDALNGRPLNVIGRTRLLLTFGSPLDKTAYIFANQWTNTTATREALAASLQPLILEYDPFRDIDWVNVCSIFDIVSNWLKFYDYRGAPGYNDRRRVQNEWDWKAITPLLAHIEYWRNTEIFLHIYEHL